MERRKKSHGKKSRLAKTKRRVRRAARKATTRSRPAARAQQAAPAAPEPKQQRPTRREADVPLEILSRTYLPKQTSLKAPFRTTGADRQRDQDVVAEERWHDEDHFTNKSGDPRIGTHRRKYEPGE